LRYLEAARELAESCERCLREGDTRLAAVAAALSISASAREALLKAGASEEDLRYAFTLNLPAILDQWGVKLSQELKSRTIRALELERRVYTEGYKPTREEAEEALAAAKALLEAVGE